MVDDVACYVSTDPAALHAPPCPLHEGGLAVQLLGGATASLFDLDVRDRPVDDGPQDHGPVAGGVAVVREGSRELADDFAVVVGDVAHHVALDGDAEVHEELDEPLRLHRRQPRRHEHVLSTVDAEQHDDLFLRPCDLGVSLLSGNAWFVNLKKEVFTQLNNR